MNAITKNGPRSGVYQSTKPGTVVDETGGLYVTVEQLMKFGNGDAARGRRELRSFLSTDRDGPTFHGPTEKPKSVRLAGAGDEQALLDLLMIDLRENAAFVAPINQARVLEMIQVGTRFRGGFAGMILGTDGKPVAVTILHPQQWWWSQGWYFVEVVNFVHPDHQRSQHINELIAFGKWVADEQTRGFGYQVHLLCGVLGIHRFWTKTAMYRRKAMQVGAAFIYPALGRKS